MRVSSIIFADEIYSFENNHLEGDSNYILTVCLKGCALAKFSGKQSSVVMEGKTAVLSSVEQPCEFINASDDCVLISTYFSVDCSDVERMKDWFFFLSYEFMIELDDLLEDYKEAENCEIISQRLNLRLKYLLSRLKNREDKAEDIAC